MVRPRNIEEDETWEHCAPVKQNCKTLLRCNYCQSAFHGGVYRMKHHLARTHKNAAICTQCPESVAQKFKDLLECNLDAKRKRIANLLDSGKPEYYYGDQAPQEDKGKGPMDKFVNVEGDEGKQKQVSLNRVWNKEGRVKTCLDICRFFYANALAFNLVKSPFFTQMCESIAQYGVGLKPPSYHEIRNTFLKMEVENIENMLLHYKKEWAKRGCTIMSDGWTDKKNRSITNFLVNSPSGTVFLKSVDTSDISKNADNLCAMFESVIDEVGEENVVQIVTDNAAPYVKAGELLMKNRLHLYWGPCAAHCIDLMLEEIGKRKMQTDTITKVRSIAKFIYAHGLILNMMRKFTKGRELIRPAVTRFATCYLTLRSMVENKVGLRSMFASEDWARSTFFKKPEGVNVHDIVFDKKFWQCVIYVLKVAMPLVKVLRLVDSDATPSMAYLYEAMDRAKEEIAKNLANMKTRYMPIWKIIDNRWNYQLHKPLHAAAYYLNPSLHYDESFKADFEIKTGLYDCLDRLAANPTERLIIDDQLYMYRNAKGMFGRSTAIATRKTKQPAIWWEDYGDSTPQLQRVAIRILSLTSSASGCERNWSTFEQVHTKRRNRLEAKRMNALVFVKYNLQLRARDKLRGERGDQDPICLSDIESDDEWITEKEDPALPTDHSWLEVDEIFEEEEYVPRKRQKRNKLPVRRNHGNRNSQNTTKEKVDSVEEIVDEDGLEEGSDSGMVELMDVSEDDEGRAGDDEYDDGFLF